MDLHNNLFFFHIVFDMTIKAETRYENLRTGKIENIFYDFLLY